MPNLSKGPTLNPRYNDLLVRWGNCAPECEECGKDMTGKMIHDCGTCWACSDCKNEINGRNVSFDEEDRRIRRAEQGQSAY